MLWHNEMQADVPLTEVDDPAGLVVSGTAEPFHCCLQLHAPALPDGIAMHPRLARISARAERQLAEEQTKLVRFGRFAELDGARRKDGSPIGGSADTASKAG